MQRIDEPNPITQTRVSADGADLLAVSEEDLSTLIDSVTFTRQFGFRIHELAVGRCGLYVPFRREFERPGGIVSGQVFMAAADVAMWLALKTRLGLAMRR